MSKSYTGTKKNVILSYINLAVKMLTGFFLLPFIVSSLGNSDYGLMRLVYSLTGYIGILDLGLGNAVTRFTALYNTKEKKKKINTVVTYSLLIYSGVAVLGFLVGLIVYFNFGSYFNLAASEVDVGKKIFMIGLINSLLQLPAMTFSAVIKGFNKYDYFYGTRVAKSILRAILIVILFKMGFGILTLFIIDFTTSQLLNLSWFVFNIKKLGLKFSLDKLDPEFKNEFGTYSFYVFLGIVTDQIYWKTDNILLGIFTSTEKIAVYSISQQIIRYYKTIASSFTGAFLPKLTNMVSDYKSKDKILSFFKKASRYQFLIVIIILINFIFLGKEFIILWVGKNFIEAYKYTLIIMIPLSIPLFQTTGFKILYAKNKHKTRSIVYLINAIVNIFISIYLIDLIGVIGAAFGTAIAMILGNVLFMNYYYKKELGLKIYSFFKETCFKTLLLIIPTIIILWISNIFISNISIVNFIIKGTLANIPFVILIYKYVIDEKDKEDVLSYLK
ncbi:lipopolysaccharide biosynthesis protein [Halanaerobaculum tunisiense]